MQDEEVKKETITPEESSVTTDENIQSSEPTHEELQVQEETPQQGNFRELREAKEKAEKERDEALAYAQQYQQQYQEPQYQDPYYPPSQEDYNVNIADDDLAEGKHLNKMAKKIQDLENQIYQNQQYNNDISTEAVLRAKYPDFESVVTNANLKKLRQDYPEIADSLNASPDLYKKAVSAYTLIKKFDIGKGDPYMANKNKAQKNSAKPRPLASVSPQQGDTPLSHANAFAEGLTEELKAKLRKEMEEIRKNH